MKQLFLCFIMGIFIPNLYSQPQDISSKPVQINNVIYGQDTLYFERLGYFSNGIHLQKEKENGYSYNAISAWTRVNLPDEDEKIYYNFIFEGDTMSLRPLYLQEYPDYLNISINSLHFSKGRLTIDLYECVRSRKKSNNIRVIIDDFPCDCMEYLIENEELLKAPK